MSIETSAKAGHNVKTLFKKIAMALPGGNEAKDSGATSKSVCFGELLMGVEIDVSASPQEVPQASGCSCQALQRSSRIYGCLTLHCV